MQRTRILTGFILSILFILSKEVQHEELTGKIIGAAMRLHPAIRPGYLESVYATGLALELRADGLVVQRQQPLHVRYRGVIIGEFFADMVVENAVIVEIKAVRALAPQHDAQVVSYLTTTGLDVGLLLNFGAPRLEFRRKYRLYRDGPGERGDAS